MSLVYSPHQYPPHLSYIFMFIPENLNFLGHNKWVLTQTTLKSCMSYQLHGTHVMRSQQFLSYSETSYILWSPKVWYWIHVSCYLLLCWPKINPLHITNFIIPSSYEGVGYLFTPSNATGISITPLLFKTSSDTFLLMSSQCDRIVTLK